MAFRRRTHLRNLPGVRRGHARQPGRAAHRCRRGISQSPSRATALVRPSRPGRPCGSRDRSDQRNSDAVLVRLGGSRSRGSVARRRPALPRRIPRLRVREGCGCSHIRQRIIRMHGYQHNIRHARFAPRPHLHWCRRPGVSRPP
jgi:hypothetical protein